MLFPPSRVARQAEARPVNELRHVNLKRLGNDVVITIDQKDDGPLRGALADSMPAILRDQGAGVTGRYFFP